MKSLYFVLVLMIFLHNTQVFSQGIDASPAGIMISHGHPKGGWMVSYTFMNMMMNGNLSGTEKVSDDEIFINDYSMSPQKMQMDMHMLMAMYGLTGRLSFMLMASYSDYRMDMKSYAAGHVHGGSGAPSLNHTHHTSGVGDTKLWALYKLVNGEGSSLVLSAGLNLPSGNYKIPAGEHAIIEGERQAYMMQLGSGSYDLMPGLTFYKKSGKLAWSAQALANIRPFENPLGYHIGSDLTLNVWGAYYFGSAFSASLRAEGFEGGKINGSDPMIYVLSEPDANPDNHGGTKANAYAGINFYFNKSFMRNSKIGVELGLPFYQNLNGPQMATQYSLNAGIVKSF